MTSDVCAHSLHPPGPVHEDPYPSPLHPALPLPIPTGDRPVARASRVQMPPSRTTASGDARARWSCAAGAALPPPAHPREATCGRCSSTATGVFPKVYMPLVMLRGSRITTGDTRGPLEPLLRPYPAGAAGFHWLWRAAGVHVFGRNPAESRLEIEPSAAQCGPRTTCTRTYNAGERRKRFAPVQTCPTRWAVWPAADTGRGRLWRERGAWCAACVRPHVS